MVNVSSYNQSISNDDGIVEVVPEPPAWLMVLAGLFLLGGVTARRRGALSLV